MKKQPRYPIYVPSKGRADRDLTLKCLREAECPVYLVVEKEEYDAYASRHARSCTILTLPKSGQGIIYVRNWIKKHATDLGSGSHWEIDDNIRCWRRWYKSRRLPMDAGIAIRACEDFTDRYTNVGLSGFDYTMFQTKAEKPFRLNAHVYSCTLYRNDLPEFRGPANEDVDMCLQVLSAGLCTIQLGAMMIEKMPTEVLKGGNTDEMYFGDNRLKNARALERRWPGVVSVDRRFKRPHFKVGNAWKKFDTPLIRRDDLEINESDAEYGMTLKQRKPIKSANIRRIFDGANSQQSD